MRVFGIIGESGSGKTTVIESIIPELEKTGRVGTIKAIHHDIEVDEPGKDTYRHRDAGATAVTGITPNQTFEIKTGGKRHASALPDAASHGLRNSLDRYGAAGFEYTIIEGFSGSGIPKVVLGDRPEESAGEIIVELPSQPSAQDAITPVLTAIDHLHEYETSTSIWNGLRSGMSNRDEMTAATLRCCLTIPLDGTEWVGDQNTHRTQLQIVIESITTRLGRRDGVIESRWYCRPPIWLDDLRYVLLTILGDTPDATFNAITAGRTQWTDTLDDTVQSSTSMVLETLT